MIGSVVVVDSSSISTIDVYNCQVDLDHVTVKSKDKYIRLTLLLNQLADDGFEVIQSVAPDPQTLVFLLRKTPERARVQVLFTHNERRIALVDGELPEMLDSDCEYFLYNGSVGGAHVHICSSLTDALRQAQDFCQLSHVQFILKLPRDFVMPADFSS